MSTRQITNESFGPTGIGNKQHKNTMLLKKLRISLKYRPDILKLILRMRKCIKQKNELIKHLKHQLKSLTTDTSKQVTQTDKENTKHKSVKKSNGKSDTCKSNNTSNTEKPNTDEELESSTKVTNDWNVEGDRGDATKSIAEQVKEVAQTALQQTGMVYVESAGMYYDYKTGYYYNSELGLYYHTDTGCYYYYSDEKQTFVFHSYPDRSATAINPAFEAHQKKKARKNKKAQKTEEEEGNGPSKPKKRKKLTNKEKTKSKDEKPTEITDTEANAQKDPENNNEETAQAQELEDGECSNSDEDQSDDADDQDDVVSIASTVSASDDDSVAKHLPPCMRVILRSSSVSRLRPGSLFLVTKDGGSVGREGPHHTILLPDPNVSRDHMQIKYDMTKRSYVAIDLGSKNGSILNGTRMSESQIVSEPMEIVHGSTLQLGDSTLLCHVHAGNDTCGHCEPGLVMDNEEKEKKVAYTRTCSVSQQHQLELARLKNKYSRAPRALPAPTAPYTDRAQARRHAVGSSHHAEKTVAADLDTSIAPENKGFKLLQKMGWSKGEGLGKESQGDTEPIPLISNEGKSGLGTAGAAAAPVMIPFSKPANKLGPATLRLASKTKMLQPPAKAFQNPLEDEEESE